MCNERYVMLKEHSESIAEERTIISQILSHSMMLGDMTRQEMDKELAVYDNEYTEIIEEMQQLLEK